MGHSISRGLKDVCLHSLNDKGKVYEMPGMCPICLYGKNQGLGGMLDSYKRIMDGMSKLVALIPDFKAESMTDAVAQIIARMTKAEKDVVKKDRQLEDAVMAASEGVWLTPNDLAWKICSLFKQIATSEHEARWARQELTKAEVENKKIKLDLDKLREEIASLKVGGPYP